jgi:hypothetical protein
MQHSIIRSASLLGDRRGLSTDSRCKRTARLVEGLLDWR